MVDYNNVSYYGYKIFGTLIFTFDKRLRNNEYVLLNRATEYIYDKFEKENVDIFIKELIAELEIYEENTKWNLIDMLKHSLKSIELIKT